MDEVSLFDVLPDSNVVNKLTKTQQTEAIAIVERFTKRFEFTCERNCITSNIAEFICAELLKSDEVSLDVIQKIVQSFPYLPGERLNVLDDKEDEEEEEEEEEESFSDPELEENEIAWRQHWIATANGLVTPEDEKNIALECNEIGCQMNEGQKDEIAKCMMKFLCDSETFPAWQSPSSSRHTRIRNFIQLVKKYMMGNNSYDLKDVKVVESAIKNVELEWLKYAPLPPVV